MTSSSLEWVAAAYTLALAVGLFSLLESTGFVHVGVKDVKADVVTL